MALTETQAKVIKDVVVTLVSLVKAYFDKHREKLGSDIYIRGLTAYFDIVGEQGKSWQSKVKVLDSKYGMTLHDLYSETNLKNLHLEHVGKQPEKGDVKDYTAILLNPLNAKLTEVIRPQLAPGSGNAARKLKTFSKEQENAFYAQIDAVFEEFGVEVQPMSEKSLIPLRSESPPPSYGELFGSSSSQTERVKTSSNIRNS